MSNKIVFSALHVSHFTSQIELALKQQDQNHNQLQKLAQSVKVHPIYDINSKIKTAGSSGSGGGGGSMAGDAVAAMLASGGVGLNTAASSQSSSSSSSSSKGSGQPSGQGTSSSAAAASGEPPNDPESPFDKGLRSLKGTNSLVVVRGLVGLLLGMDFTCNMDLFLLTCKVIARLVSACRPSIQLSRIMTTSQLQQLIRIAVWKDQQQPWAVHAITCLLQDILEADKIYKQSNIVYNTLASNDAMDIIPTSETEEFNAGGSGGGGVGATPNGKTKEFF